MKSSRALLALGAAVILMATPWLVPIPETFPSTYVAVLTWLVAVGTVTMFTWRTDLRTAGHDASSKTRKSVGKKVGL